MNRLIIILSAVAAATVITLIVVVITVLGKTDGVKAGDVKLLESIINHDGSMTKFEYDDQNRIVKFITAHNETITLTYSGNKLVSVVRPSNLPDWEYDEGRLNFNIGDNTIGIQAFESHHNLTVNNDGYIVKSIIEIIGEQSEITYYYKNGNLIKQTITTVFEETTMERTIEYKYDNKKSPFYYCNTPKWFIQLLIEWYFSGLGLNNNIVESKDSSGSLQTYAYEYDSDGFPASQPINNSNNKITFVYRSSITKNIPITETPVENVLPVEKTDEEIIYALPAAGLRLWENASLEGKIIKTLPQYTRLTVLEKGKQEETIDDLKGFWYKVSVGNEEGWVFGAYVGSIITVKTAAEFVAAIGSNRNILLKEGVYNLSTDDLRKINNTHVSWQNVHDGWWQMNVRNVQNMTIRGEGKKPVEIIVDPVYAFVIEFYDSKNLTIENITAGHSEEGWCTGGVFSFRNCTDIKINKTQMYGSGTVGLQLNNVANMEVTNSTIYECTYSIVEINTGRNISFKNCLFRDNKEFSMVDVSDGSNIVFDGCEFRNNQVRHDSYFFFHIRSGEDVIVRNTKFINNRAANFVNSDIALTFENCTFSENSFSGY